MPLALIAAAGIVRWVPAVVHGEKGGADGYTLNRVVYAATLIAALTFAVMIGCCYLASQYLQRDAGYSALGASSALVIVAFLVGAAAPIAGRLVDEHGERLPAILGFVLAGGGLAVLAIPGMPLSSLVTILPLIPVGFGLGMLFAPTSRAALNATPQASHGRTSAVLSVGRLVRRRPRRRAGRRGACGWYRRINGARRDAARVHPVRRRGDSRVDSPRDPQRRDRTPDAGDVAARWAPAGRSAGTTRPPRPDAHSAFRRAVFAGPVGGIHLDVVSGRPSVLNLRLTAGPIPRGWFGRCSAASPSRSRCGRSW